MGILATMRWSLVCASSLPVRVASDRAAARSADRAWSTSWPKRLNASSAARPLVPVVNSTMSAALASWKKRSSTLLRVAHHQHAIAVLFEQFAQHVLHLHVGLDDQELARLALFVESFVAVQFLSPPRPSFAPFTRLIASLSSTSMSPGVW